MLTTPKETIIKKVPDPRVYYALAGLWLIGTFMFPMYKFSSYLILGAASVAAYVLLRYSVFKDREVEVEVETPRTYYSKVQQQFIEDGTRSLNSIMELNKQIDNQDINDNVNDLVKTTDSILDYVYQHEQAATGMRKLVNYYLPTVEKLLKRYDEIEDNDSIENVRDSKKKVQDIIKTTAEAFRNQLNALYDTDTLDISSEVKVLEQIYVREGLIDPDNKVK